MHEEGAQRLSALSQDLGTQTKTAPEGKEVEQTLALLAEVLRAASEQDYIGEPVSQLEHALQCAHFARTAGASDELVLAALFHDVGHGVADPAAARMPELGVLDHERVGAEFLRRLGFSQKVCALVEGHVQAKRYLVSTSDSYSRHLSEASRRTLEFQGGAMTVEDCRRFEEDPLFSEKVLLRRFDEAAKRADLQVAPIEDYRELLTQHLLRMPEEGEGAPLPGAVSAAPRLTPEQLRFWEIHGYLLLKNFYSPEQTRRFRSWVEEMEKWPETPGKWMKYFEKGPMQERLLCRVEDFIPYHDELRALLKGEAVLGLVSDLMGERAVLFKEKINYKLPGGKGFTPHQDAPAFTTFDQKYHITLMTSVDATTAENGGLEVVPGRHREGIFAQEADGSMAADEVQQMHWELLATEPGDVLLFDSYIPHRSGPNRTQAPRRAYYVTYNRESEGDRRDAYYEDKRAQFPPEIERIPGRDYSAGAARYNLANPIQK